MLKEKWLRKFLLKIRTILMKLPKHILRSIDRKMHDSKISKGPGK